MEALDFLRRLSNFSFHLLTSMVSEMPLNVCGILLQAAHLPVPYSVGCAVYSLSAAVGPLLSGSWRAVKGHSARERDVVSLACRKQQG